MAEPGSNLFLRSLAPQPFNNHFKTNQKSGKTVQERWWWFEESLRLWNNDDTLSLLTRSAGCATSAGIHSYIAHWLMNYYNHLMDAIYLEILLSPNRAYRVCS